jgi:AraC-like DNA-binding protein
LFRECEQHSSQCRFDLLSLGECVVRLAPPGHGRIEFARSFDVDVGGGEFNVGYACARLGLRCGFTHPSAFAHQVRRHLGVTPREFRRRRSLH